MFSGVYTRSSSWGRGGGCDQCTGKQDESFGCYNAFQVSLPLSSSSSDEDKAKGRVYAFERDAIRYKTLVKRLTAVGAIHNAKGNQGNVFPEKKDFLTTKPTDFERVTHMLLDPSCSGSGIVNRLDFLKEDDDVEDTPLPSPSTPSSTSSEGGATMTKLEKRLLALSEFQLLMIRHAFQFPALQKVVYSTCSIHAQENEEVVIKALDSHERKNSVGFGPPGRRSTELARQRRQEGV